MSSAAKDASVDLNASLEMGREEVVNDPETLTPITHGATLAGKALKGHWRTPWRTVRRWG